jgi:PhoPQ-activated pathogenicity-related protein
MRQRLIRLIPTAPTLQRDSAVRNLSRLALVSLIALLLPRCVVGKEAVAEPPANAAAAKSEIPTALQDYVSASDDSYAYKVVGAERIDGCTVHKLELTSQTWQDILWKHALYIYVPANIQHKQTVLLFITGGKVGGTPGDDDMKMAAKIAQAAAMPVAFLHQVPNQPLLGDKVEDDLISETFLRYVDSRDATWPLLFPMVKSATAAMTAVQDFGKQQYDVDVEQFVVTGGSKRGWTTWLTAVADDRVAGIAPIVIDTLNLPAQMKYQLETWGEYSEQIGDYTSKGLVEVMENQPEIPLWQWVDPYTYRSVLTLPKLLINGTNDRYWTVDATNVYWDDLLGEKHVRYVPNAGTRARRRQRGGAHDAGRVRPACGRGEVAAGTEVDPRGGRRRVPAQDQFDAGARVGTAVGREVRHQGLPQRQVGSDGANGQRRGGRRRRRVRRRRGEAGDRGTSPSSAKRPIARGRCRTISRRRCGASNSRRVHSDPAGAGERVT